MIPSDAEAWARLRLVQGRANAQLWELVQSAGQTTLTVGANAGCNWPITDTGVAPIHFTLHWDGKHLHAADTYGAGDVRIDGQPLARHFRVVSGRARIDFGHAAIVVETSINSEAEPAHPLDPGPLPALATRSAPPGRIHSHNTTLLGVSPMAVPPTRGVEGSSPNGHAAASSSRPPQGGTPSPKSTLLGMTPVPETVAVAAGIAVGAGVDGNGRPAKNLGATLLGMGAEAVAAAVANARAASASLAERDQRTAQGFPADAQRHPSSPAPHAAGRRETQQGIFSAPPGVSSSAVREARVKAISGAPSPIPAASPIAAVAASAAAVANGGRTTWEEIPSELGRSRESGPAYAAVPVSDDMVPQAVMVDEPAYSSTPPPSSAAAADDTWRPRPREPRFSDAPTGMRDVTSFESRRPRRPIPWQYVGLGVLTAIAYVAWLYLLDHF